MTGLVDDGEELVCREIESWLDDEDQLAELGRRCVALLVGSRVPFPVPVGLLRGYLAGDWLTDCFATDGCPGS